MENLPCSHGFILGRAYNPCLSLGDESRKRYGGTTCTLGVYVDHGNNNFFLLIELCGFNWILSLLLRETGEKKEALGEKRERTIRTNGEEINS